MVDPRAFWPYNVADTCAVWNVLSSMVLYRASIDAQCEFCCTEFVLYECMYKPRASLPGQERELRRRLTQERRTGRFCVHSIEIDDLNDVEVLRRRRNLSKGELSSMVFAKKTGQAFITDDQAARKLAVGYLEDDRIQTTPHLFGWLIFSGFLGDSDRDAVIEEHTRLGRPLGKYFDVMYFRALELRLAESTVDSAGM